MPPIDARTVRCRYVHETMLLLLYSEFIIIERDRTQSITCDPESGPDLSVSTLSTRYMNACLLIFFIFIFIRNEPRIFSNVKRCLLTAVSSA